MKNIKLMNYPQRMYSKTELGLLYFPDTTDGATARRHIMVWIKLTSRGHKEKPPGVSFYAWRS